MIYDHVDAIRDPLKQEGLAAEFGRNQKNLSVF